ncbi:MAG: hypothetical protein PHX43_05395 [Alphaproteobacteria bacterium]|nr:hypothetical protein [Alphaproteobacteria bacterium]
MGKLKEFWKKHQVEVIVTAGVGAIIGVTYLFVRGNPNLYDMTGKSFISWTPGNKFMSLERVLEILELNKNSAGQFAIFREGTDPSKYVCIILNDAVNL